jgi:hypothetical protein
MHKYTSIAMGYDFSTFKSGWPFILSLHSLSFYYQNDIFTKKITSSIFFPLSVFLFRLLRPGRQGHVFLPVQLRAFQNRR